MAAKPKLYLSGDPESDRLLSEDGFALLVGLVLDQQIPLEKAFSSPKGLNDRLGRRADAALVAAMDRDELSSLFRTPPALHRFPSAMAERVQEMSAIVVKDYGGDPARIWKTASSGEELRQRLEALPGFGKQKARIFLAFLGKQLGVRPDGWEQESAPFGETGSLLSIADITSPATLAAVREHKREMKAAAKRVAGQAGDGSRQRR